MTKAVVPTNSAALVKGVPAREAIRLLAEQVPEADEDEDVGEVIIARILNAENLDDLLTPASAPSMGSLVDVPILVHDIRRREGGLNKDLGFYLIVAAEVQGTGEQAVFSTGANNVVAQLLKANAEGHFPMACKVLEMPSKSNPERSVQWLVKLDNF